MPSFSAISLKRLDQCDERLKSLFLVVVKEMDCTVRCSYRGETEQNHAYEQGYSKLKYPESKHNKLPSLAVDVYPYPIPKKKEAYYYFAGYVMAKAKDMGINLRCGCDWDRDNDISDQKFNDLVHFELV